MLNLAPVACEAPEYGARDAPVRNTIGTDVPRLSAVAQIRMHSRESTETPGIVSDVRTTNPWWPESVGAPLVVVACLFIIVTVMSATTFTIALANSVLVGFGALLAWRQRRATADQVARLREQNQALLEQTVRKDEFLATVCHELRTPVNVVLGYVDLLLDHSFGSLQPAQRDILHRIMKNAGNLTHLITDLVDLSRLDAARMRIEMQVVELRPLFADLTAVMEILLAGHDVTFIADLSPGCDRVRADPGRLKQIVSNLLVNAVKFTERGSITLRATTDVRARVAITVSDTGIGIPAADQHVIFEPFRQVHDRERRAPGAGIGLSISSRLATLMGGTIEVESAPGAGSRFTLTLDGLPANTLEASREASTPIPVRKVS